MITNGLNNPQLIVASLFWHEDRASKWRKTGDLAQIGPLTITMYRTLVVTSLNPTVNSLSGFDIKMQYFN